MVGFRVIRQSTIFSHKYVTSGCKGHRRQPLIAFNGALHQTAREIAPAVRHLPNASQGIRKLGRLMEANYQKQDLVQNAIFLNARDKSKSTENNSCKAREDN